MTVNDFVCHEQVVFLCPGVRVMIGTDTMIHILLESIDMTVGQTNASDQYECGVSILSQPHISIKITGEKVSYSVISGLSFSHHIVV